MILPLSNEWMYEKSTAVLKENFFLKNELFRKKTCLDDIKRWKIYFLRCF